jgi:hypothetical protein
MEIFNTSAETWPPNKLKQKLLLEFPPRRIKKRESPNRGPCISDTKKKINRPESKARYHLPDSSFSSDFKNKRSLYDSFESDHSRPMSVLPRRPTPDETELFFLPNDRISPSIKTLNSDHNCKRCETNIPKQNYRSSASNHSSKAHDQNHNFKSHVSNGPDQIYISNITQNHASNNPDQNYKVHDQMYRSNISTYNTKKDEILEYQNQLKNLSLQLYLAKNLLYEIDRRVSILENDKNLEEISDMFKLIQSSLTLFDSRIANIEEKTFLNKSQEFSNLLKQNDLIKFDDESF